MAAVPVIISGVLFDKYGRTGEPVTLMGMASIAGLGVGGGPMPPGPGGPPSIWPSPGHPEHPIFYPPSIWPDPRPPGQPPGFWGGSSEGFPTHPGPILPPSVPPGLQPPEPPQPGDPTTPVPPPAGSPGWPVQPVVVPSYVVINYPGIGPVYVAPPVSAGPSQRP